MQQPSCDDTFLALSPFGIIPFWRHLLLASSITPGLYYIGDLLALPPFNMIYLLRPPFGINYNIGAMLQHCFPCLSPLGIINNAMTVQGQSPA